MEDLAKVRSLILKQQALSSISINLEGIFSWEVITQFWKEGDLSLSPVIYSINTFLEGNSMWFHLPREIHVDFWSF